MSAVLDAIAAGDIGVVGLSISLPGTTFRAAASAFTSATNGHHSAKVLRWGRISNQASDRGGQPPPVVTTVLLDDKDRTLARIYAGTRAKDVRGSAASIYLMAQSVTSVDTRFVGVVSKMTFTADLNCEITLRVQDDQLSRKAPRAGWAHTPQVFPNADPEVYEKTAGILYGTYDASRLRTGPGLIPAPCVDKILFRYGGWAGNLKSLTRVYVNGVEYASSNYGSASPWNDGAFEYATIHGRDYTFVRFAADQGDAEITIDCVGIEDDGDGSGAVITNPITQLEHCLSNFVFADYQSGSSLSTHALIGSLSAVRNYLGANGTGVLNLGAQGAFYLDKFRTGLDIIGALCKSWRVYSFWTPDGTLSLGIDDTFATPYTGTRFIWSRDELGPFSFVEDDYPVTSSILTRMCYSQSDGSYLTSFEVQDAGANSETQDTIDVEWSATS